MGSELLNFKIQTICNNEIFSGLHQLREPGGQPARTYRRLERHELSHLQGPQAKPGPGQPGG